jgi:hypothetical protein
MIYPAFLFPHQVKLGLSNAYLDSVFSLLVHKLSNANHYNFCQIEVPCYLDPNMIAIIFVFKYFLKIYIF